MKKCTIVLFLLFAAITGTAQEAVFTQGDSYSNASGSIAFTTGLEDFVSNYEAIIFPNPTEDVFEYQNKLRSNWHKPINEYALYTLCKNSRKI